MQDMYDCYAILFKELGYPKYLREPGTKPPQMLRDDYHFIWQQKASSELGVTGHVTPLVQCLGRVQEDTPSTPLTPCTTQTSPGSTHLSSSTRGQKQEDEEKFKVILSTSEFEASLGHTGLCRKTKQNGAVPSQSLAAKFLLPVRHIFFFFSCLAVWGALEPSLLLPLVWIEFSVWIPGLETPWFIAVLLMVCALSTFIGSTSVRNVHKPISPSDSLPLTQPWAPSMVTAVLIPGPRSLT